jgi:hypothetical protein
MAIAKVIAKQLAAVDRVSEGGEVYLRAIRDGSLSIANFAQTLALEGRVFIAQAGTATTPVTFGAGSIDTTEPDLVVEVPSGTVILPLYLSLHMEAYGSNAIFECIASYGTGGVAANYTCTHGAAITPVNMKAATGITSACTIHSGMNGSSWTYQTGSVVEFFRNGMQSAITKSTAVNNIANLDSPTGYLFEWSAKQTGVQPIVIGAAALTVFAAAQASTGYIKLVYAELPTSAV